MGLVDKIENFDSGLRNTLVSAIMSLTIAGCADEAQRCVTCPEDGKTSQRLVVEYLEPCDTETGEDEFTFDLAPANMPGVESIEYEEVNVDECGYVNAGYGQWVQRTQVFNITSLEGSEEAKDRFDYVIGKNVEFLLFPKTANGEGSTLVSVNGDSIRNAATEMQYVIKSSGLQEGEKCTLSPLKNGVVNATIEAYGEKAESMLTKNGRISIPDGARKDTIDLLDFYGVN